VSAEANKASYDICKDRTPVHGCMSLSGE
jgi:hypothetical protein